MSAALRLLVTLSGPRRPAADPSRRPLRVISRRNAAPISMSAFGGKADVNHCVGECPLLAKNGPKNVSEKSGGGATLVRIRDMAALRARRRSAV